MPQGTCIPARKGRVSPLLPPNFASIKGLDPNAVLFGKHEEFGRIQPGLLEKAGGGTLYFEEVFELPMDVQGTLMRCLTQSAFQRVGGTERVPLRCRILAGTSKDIASAAKEKEYNKDLYGRISMLKVEVPALEDRVGDIEPLADHFVKQLSEGRRFSRTQT